MLTILFFVLHFNFLFILCDRLSWLPVSFLLHVKYTLSYRIVSYFQASYQNVVIHHVEGRRQIQQHQCR